MSRDLLFFSARFQEQVEVGVMCEHGPSLHVATTDVPDDMGASRTCMIMSSNITLITSMLRKRGRRWRWWLVDEEQGGEGWLRRRLVEEDAEEEREEVEEVVG